MQVLQRLVKSYISFFICKALHSLIFEYFFYLFFSGYSIILFGKGFTLYNHHSTDRYLQRQLFMSSGKDDNYCIEYKKKVRKKEEGSQILGCTYARGGGGGHSDAYCVQQGGLGVLKIGKKCIRN